MEQPLLDPNAPINGATSVVLRADDENDGNEGHAIDGGNDVADTTGGVSVSRSIFVMTNAILGGGILGQAYAARSAGWVPGWWAPARPAACGP